MIKVNKKMLKEFLDIMEDFGEFVFGTEEEKKGYNPVPESVFCTEKLERLGWKANTSIMNGLMNTINELQ